MSWVCSALVCLIFLNPQGEAATPPDARSLVVRALKADEVAARAATRYTYQQSETTKERDPDGHLRKQTSKVTEILFLGGKRYERLVSRDGKPLPAREAAREEARMGKAAAEASHLTAAEKDARFAEWDRERARQREVLHSIPDAFTFRLLGEPVVDNHLCWLVEAKPRSDYHGKFGNILRSMEGKLWINQADAQWVRIEADVLADVTFGLFLGRLEQGAHFLLERTVVNGEVWLPKRIELRFAGRALLKHANVEDVITYGEYRRYSSDSRILSVEESNSPK